MSHDTAERAAEEHSDETDDDRPVIRASARWRERPADERELRRRRGQVHLSDGGADPVDLTELVERLEAINWAQVPGLSAVTAATFAAEVLQARARLRAAERERANPPARLCERSENSGSGASNPTPRADVSRSTNGGSDD